MHLEGKPHGPSLSFPSTSVVEFFAVVSVGFVAVESGSVFAVTFSSFTSPFVVPGSQKLTLLTTLPNVSPR